MQLCDEFVQIKLIPFGLTFTLCSAGEAGFKYNFSCRHSRDMAGAVLWLRGLLLLLPFALHHVWMGPGHPEHTPDVLTSGCF